MAKRVPDNAPPKKTINKLSSLRSVFWSYTLLKPCDFPKPHALNRRLLILWAAQLLRCLQGAHAGAAGLLAAVPIRSGAPHAAWALRSTWAAPRRTQRHSSGWATPRVNHAGRAPDSLRCKPRGIYSAIRREARLPPVTARLQTGRKPRFDSTGGPEGHGYP